MGLGRMRRTGSPPGQAASRCPVAAPRRPCLDPMSARARRPAGADPPMPRPSRDGQPDHGRAGHPAPRESSSRSRARLVATSRHSIPAVAERRSPRGVSFSRSAALRQVSKIPLPADSPSKRTVAGVAGISRRRPTRAGAGLRWGTPATPLPPATRAPAHGHLAAPTRQGPRALGRSRPSAVARSASDPAADVERQRSVGHERDQDARAHPPSGPIQTIAPL